MPKRILCAMLTVACLLAVARSTGAIDAPPWDGPKDLETKYRQDWYACYTEAEKTVPPLKIQVTGPIDDVVIAAKSREKAVNDLVLACLGARGYTPTYGIAPAAVPRPTAPAK